MRTAEDRLLDMESSCTLLIKFAGEMDSYENLLRSDVYRGAMLHELFVMGEAADHISDFIKQKYDDIEWREIKDLRNVIAHEYFGIDWPLVWEMVLNDVPPLLARIQFILMSEFNNGK